MQYVLLPNWHEKFMETSLVENIFVNIGTICMHWLLVVIYVLIMQGSYMYMCVCLDGLIVVMNKNNI